MTDFSNFDRYASNYSETVNAAITASGEDAEFFSELKVELIRKMGGTSLPRAILDFGCGIGNTTRALARAFPSAIVTGCDTSSESIEVANRSSSDAHRTRFVAYRGSVLPFANCRFHLVFASCVFHHISPGDRLSWLRELYRVAAPETPVCLFEHNPYNPLTLRVVRDCPFDVGVELLRPRNAVRLLESVGFRVTRPRYYFFFPKALRGFRVLEPYLNRLPLGGQYYVAGWRPS